MTAKVNQNRGASGSPKLDRYDLAILTTLQKQGRITKVALADAVNLSPTPCWERLRKLEDAGFIAEYRGVVDIAKISPITEFIAEVKLCRHTQECVAQFEALVESLSEVTDCWATVGGVDYFLKIITRDVASYRRLVDRIVSADSCVEKFFGYPVSAPVKSEPPDILKIIDGGADR